MKKRIMAILLSAVMILSLGGTAFAETVSAGDSSEATLCEKTEGCTLEAGHEGDCILKSTEDVEEPESQTTDETDETEAEKLQNRIDALPDSDALAEMSSEEQQEVYAEICDIYDAVDALGEDADSLELTNLEAAAGFFTEQVMPLDTACVAKIGDQEYETLAAAVAAAKAGETITLLSDASGSGIIIDTSTIDNLTIDFGGHTYTVNEDPLAGSTNTRSQCFQLLTGGSLTMKNGTIKADNSGVAMIIQNYCNLTLDGMTIDGSSMTRTDATTYALSNNCGEVTISNSTITAKSGDVAFDVYGWSGSYSDVSVAVTNGSVINGTVEVARKASTNNNQNTLVIENSTVNGNVSVVAGTSVTIENATVDGSVTVTQDSGASVLVMDSTVTNSVTGDATVYNSTVNGETTNTAASGVVALVGDTTYTTLAAAIEAAKDGGTVILLANASDVTIPSGTTVTIDLNGYTISSTSNHAITNNGTLTVTGSGTVDGGTTSGKGALYNAPGATATLNGGTFTGSKWYVIKNLGTMTIDGASVVQNDSGSSGIDNGYYGGAGANDCYVTYPSSATVALTIKSGSLSGGMNTVKNDDFGVLTIEGGTFTNTSSPLVLNWNKATISGGTFTSTAENSAVLANGNCGTADVGELTITGGTFVASDDGAGSLLTYPLGSKSSQGTLAIEGGTFTGVWPADTSSLPYTVAISGGTFSTEVPEEYCADGFAPKANADGTYGVHVHTAVKTEAKAATCTEAGNTAYWYCAECGKYFSDEELTVEIALADTVIAATGHKNVTKVEAKAATETEAGNIAYWYCSDCGKYFSDEALTKEITQADTVIAATGHKNVTKVETKAATCTTAGNIAYWYCSDCGKYFSDEALTKEITQANTVLAATGHNHVTKVDAKAATSTTAGNITYWYCSDCGKYFSDEALTKEITKADTVVAATGSTTTTTVQTGDTSNIMLWVVLLTISCGGLVTLLVLSKKPRYTGRRER